MGSLKESSACNNHPTEGSMQVQVSAGESVKLNPRVRTRRAPQPDHRSCATDGGSAAASKGYGHGATLTMVTGQPVDEEDTNVDKPKPLRALARRSKKEDRTQSLDEEDFQLPDISRNPNLNTDMTSYVSEIKGGSSEWQQLGGYVDEPTGHVGPAAPPPGPQINMLLGEATFSSAISSSSDSEDDDGWDPSWIPQRIPWPKKSSIKFPAPAAGGECTPAGGGGVKSSCGQEAHETQCGFLTQKVSMLFLENQPASRMQPNGASSMRASAEPGPMRSGGDDDHVDAAAHAVVQGPQTPEKLQKRKRVTKSDRLLCQDQISSEFLVRNLPQQLYGLQFPTAARPHPSPLFCGSSLQHQQVPPLRNKAISLCIDISNHVHTLNPIDVTATLLHPHPQGARPGHHPSGAHHVELAGATMPATSNRRDTCIPDDDDTCALLQGVDMSSSCMIPPEDIPSVEYPAAPPVGGNGQAVPTAAADTQHNLAPPQEVQAGGNMFAAKVRVRKKKFTPKVKKVVEEIKVTPRAQQTKVTPKKSNNNNKAKAPRGGYDNGADGVGGGEETTDRYAIPFQKKARTDVDVGAAGSCACEQEDVANAHRRPPSGAAAGIFSEWPVDSPTLLQMHKLMRRQQRSQKRQKVLPAVVTILLKEKDCRTRELIVETNVTEMGQSAAAVTAPAITVLKSSEEKAAFETQPLIVIANPSSREGEVCEESAPPSRPHVGTCEQSPSCFDQAAAAPNVLGVEDRIPSGCALTSVELREMVGQWIPLEPTAPSEEPLPLPVALQQLCVSLPAVEGPPVATPAAAPPPQQSCSTNHDIAAAEESPSTPRGGSVSNVLVGDAATPFSRSPPPSPPSPGGSGGPSAYYISDTVAAATVSGGNSTEKIAINDDERPPLAAKPPVRRSLLPRFNFAENPAAAAAPLKNRILEQPVPFLRMSEQQQEQFIWALSKEAKYTKKPADLVAAMTRSLPEADSPAIAAYITRLAFKVTEQNYVPAHSDDAPPATQKIAPPPPPRVLMDSSSLGVPQELQMVAYSERSKKMVLYREPPPLMWRPRRVKYKPKVVLDSDTVRTFKTLMMLKGGGAAADEAAKWEQARQEWRVRAHHFNAIMRQVQGDRAFSKWGGSVVDSVGGAFLTQNVSDFLSSTAFMALRARFPARRQGAAAGGTAPAAPPPPPAEEPPDPRPLRPTRDDLKKRQMEEDAKYAMALGKLFLGRAMSAADAAAAAAATDNVCVDAALADVVEELRERMEETYVVSKEEKAAAAAVAAAALRAAADRQRLEEEIAAAEARKLETLTLCEEAAEVAANREAAVKKRTPPTRRTTRSQRKASGAALEAMDIHAPVTRKRRGGGGGPGQNFFPGEHRPLVSGSPIALADADADAGIATLMTRIKQEAIDNPLDIKLGMPLPPPVTPSEGSAIKQTNEAVDNAPPAVKQKQVVETAPPPPTPTIPRVDVVVVENYTAADVTAMESAVISQEAAASRSEPLVMGAAPQEDIAPPVTAPSSVLTSTNITPQKILSFMEPERKVPLHFSHKNKKPQEVCSVAEWLRRVLSSNNSAAPMEKYMEEKRVPTILSGDDGAPALAKSTEQERAPFNFFDEDNPPPISSPVAEERGGPQNLCDAVVMGNSVMEEAESVPLADGRIHEEKAGLQVECMQEVGFDPPPAPSGPPDGDGNGRDGNALASAIAWEEEGRLAVVRGKFDSVGENLSSLTVAGREKVLAATLRAVLGKQKTSREELLLLLLRGGGDGKLPPLATARLRPGRRRVRARINNYRYMNKVQFRLLTGPERARWEAGYVMKSQREKWEPVRSKIMGDEGYARGPLTDDCVDWEAVRRADVDEVADVIKDRGMNNVLAGRMKAFLERVYRDQDGSLDLEWIRKLPPNDAKAFLLSVRGLGLKSVECIRLLTLHHPSFPVDTNVGRIVVRLGWVPLEPLPEETQLHLLELYPIQAHIQQYLWPRLCTLDQQTLYELHYQMITFGKVFCTKSKPNCNACPMRSECKHFASAYSSAKLLLKGPKKPAAAERSPPPMLALPPTEAPTFSLIRPSFSVSEGVPPPCVPIIEEPRTPEPEPPVPDIEDFPLGTGILINTIGPVGMARDSYPDSPLRIGKNKITMTGEIKMGPNSIDRGPPPDTDVLARAVDLEEALKVDMDLEAAADENIPENIPEKIPEAAVGWGSLEVTIEDVPEGPAVAGSQVGLAQLIVPSQELILLPPQAAYLPVPQLKNVQRLRTVHYVYELPDNHPLLAEMDKREADDPCFYLLAIWSPDEVPESIPKINDDDASNPFASYQYGEGQEATVRGTLLVPCRTAMKGCFPLNGTYFQVNEVFADHASSVQPIEVPRTLLWSLRRRFVYFGTAVTNLFKDMSQEEIQCCFKKGYMCVRAFDQTTRQPKLLAARLHQSGAKIVTAPVARTRGRRPNYTTKTGPATPIMKEAPAIAVVGLPMSRT